MLHDYRRQLGPAAPPEWPSREDCMDAIAHSPDAAPGEDGIPYALYRLVPEVSAAIMSQVLEDLAGA